MERLLQLLSFLIPSIAQKKSARVCGKIKQTGIGKENRMPGEDIKTRGRQNTGSPAL